MTLHSMFRAWPISKPVQRPAGIRLLERNARRWRLCVSRMDLRGDLVLGMPCAASMPTSKPGRPRDRLSNMYRSEEHTSELQSHSDLVCRLLLEKKKKKIRKYTAATITDEHQDSCTEPA